MARPKKNQPTLGGYFRKLFEENPEWVKTKSNVLIQARYEKDHPGEKWDPRVRANMSNLKSVLRKKARKRGRPPGSKTMVKPVAPRAHGLEGLEIAIDHCLSNARNMNTEGLEQVISYLRRARNEVVWKMGQ